MTAREMILVGFMQAQNCSNYPASWRHPDAAPDFLSADYYQRVARVLESGRFHMAFFDDRLATIECSHVNIQRHGNHGHNKGSQGQREHQL